MMENEWIDVSATISDGMTRWPTDPAVHIYKAEKIGEQGAEANVTAIETTAHVGTHIDAPLHFFNGGKDVASVSLDKMIGPVKVIHITNPKEISLEEIKDKDVEDGGRVLFRTRNSDIAWEHAPFMENFVYLATDAAKYLADKKIKCVGVDYVSLGSKENDPEVHRLMLGNETVIIEGLKLGNVAEGDYEMICLPLKIKDSDGGPARVILRKK